MPWFVKIEQGIGEKSTFDQYVSAHHAYVRELIASGGGMMLFEAESMDEATAIVTQDPRFAKWLRQLPALRVAHSRGIKTKAASNYYTVTAWECYDVVRPGSMRSQRPNLVRTGR